MMPKLLKAGLDYTLGKGGADPRQPEIIAGDRDAFERVCSLSKSTQRSKHFVLSYAVTDRPSRDQLIDDVREFLRHISRGRDATDLAFVAVLHREAAGDQIGDPVTARERSHRLAVHLFVAEIDLASGKRLQLHYSPVHKRPLWAWLSKFNKARGYADPTDPARRRSHKPKHTQAALNKQALKAAAALVVAMQKNLPKTPESWAEIIRPYVDGARVDCSIKDGALWARLTPPGTSSASVLKLLPDGHLKIRAARSRLQAEALGKTKVQDRLDVVVNPKAIATGSSGDHSGKNWRAYLDRKVAYIALEQDAAAALEPFSAKRMRQKLSPQDLDNTTGA